MSPLTSDDTGTMFSTLQTHYYVDGDIIALQGDWVPAMYFVSEGKLELRVSSGFSM